MILNNCFSQDWILHHQKELKAADPQILEKCIHALALLGHLSETGLPFVFKGGTSLLLHLPAIRRLSIDIDIVCNAPPADVYSAVQKIATLPPFTGFSEDSRGERGLPNRRHFRLNYSPVFGGQPASHILLDVVEDSCSLATERKPVSTAFLETDQPALVTTLTADSLIADKLTAFAPHTSGVPYANPNGTGQTLQVAKQMFDIGELFTIATDAAAITTAYNVSIVKEAEYRDNRFTRDDALNDTITTCFQFCGQGLRAFPENEDAMQLGLGCKALSNHLVNNSFPIATEAKIAAAKAACLSGLILSNGSRGFDSLQYIPEESMQLREKSLTGRWAPLARLKSANVEAFHYWCMTEELVG